MGTEHYLVDTERKEVLSVGKWYELDASYGETVTLAQMEAADPHPAVIPWATGRALVLISDAASMEPWIDHDDPYLRWREGWRMWEVVGEDEVRECFGPKPVRTPCPHNTPVGPPDMLASAEYPSPLLLFPAPTAGELAWTLAWVSLRYEEVLRASVPVNVYGKENAHND